MQQQPEKYKYIKHCGNDAIAAGDLANKVGAEVYSYRRRGMTKDEPSVVWSYVVMKKLS